ncbi:Fc receptor-like protein 5 [Epinephelus lanceolatus]
MGKKKWDLYSSTEWSDVITLTVSSHRPKANLSADSRAFPAGGSATLTCSVNPPSFGWKYLWFREQTTFQHLTTQEFVFLSNGQISVSQEGLYTCIGGRGDPIYYTEYSDSVRIYKIATKGAVVTMQPNWPELYSGETVTLRCEIQGRDTKWEYEWMTTSSFKPPNQNEYRISSVSPSHIGDYWCKGRLERAQQNSTGWSISFKLTVSYKPQPVLTVSPLWLSPGASVTLNCSVKHPSAGWRFFWYKAVPKLSGNSYSYELIPGSIHGTEQDSYIVDGQTHTAGYVCRAGRGDPVYYTHYSQPKFVWSGDVRSAASLTVSPHRVQHFADDSVLLSCEGNSTEWQVKGFFEDGYLPYLPYCPSRGTMTGFTCYIDPNHLLGRTAVYWCESGSGEFSNGVNITTNYSPQPDLTVSPSWLSPGALVTLNCKVERASAGWRFYWYKGIRKQSENVYTYKPLPGSINGTEEDSYIVHVQTHTTRYYCRAGRGDPVYYTKYSGRRFVWSGEFNPAASLTVTPDRVQHFFSESVSLSCEGNATKWKVMRYTETGQLSHCSGWGRMTGSTCNIHSLQYGDGVYWCESGSGKYSNAVNITVQSPKPEDRSFLLPLLTGVLTGALLVILPLLLYRFMKSNDLCYSRSTQCQTTNQDERVHRDEMQQQTYSSLLEGDVCIYESVGGCEDTGKGLDKRSKHEEPVDTNVP